MSRHRQIYRSYGQGTTILEFAKHGKPKVYCESSDFPAVDCGQFSCGMVCSRLLRLDRFGPKSAFSAGRANRVGSRQLEHAHDESTVRAATSSFRRRQGVPRHSFAIPRRNSIVPTVLLTKPKNLCRVMTAMPCIIVECQPKTD